MDSSRTPGELFAEGKRSLEAGDKPRALAYLRMATRLAPDNESGWLMRAKATSDPKEAVDCLERALALNPGNAQAREDLVFLRMGKLQERVRAVTDASALTSVTSGGQVTSRFDQITQGNRPGLLLLVLFLVFTGFFIAASVAAMAILRATSADRIAAASTEEATSIPILQLPPTWTRSPTLTPTPTPMPTLAPTGRTKVAVSLRAGPGVAFPRIGTLPQDSPVVIAGRSSDSRYLEIEYPEPGKYVWVSSDLVELDRGEVASLVETTPFPITLPPTRRPVAIPTATPTGTPVPQRDFALGRPIEFIADCNKPWRLVGTVYSNQYGSQRLNGVLVRVWAFGQLQGTLTTGSIDYNRPGYWEWGFNKGADVQGEVAVVNQDGTLRSAPIGFHLTSKCDGPGSVTQMVLDFVGMH